MSARFRFRVWATDLGRYVPWDELWHHQTLLPKGVAGLPEDTWFWTLALAMHGGPKLLAEQWTGLSDSKDADIYEGDVISWEGARAVIRWAPETAGFCFEVLDEHEWCDDWSEDIGRSDRYEVIGNVHQPEYAHLSTPTP